ncbi:C-terminal helicase domain-containing protein [Geobacter sp.]|uniref:helicase-related protein n=1 Tax=Geobacter sp. TaxID=46610 RepID=UPI002626B7A1|nr:C-terminal helicase domain-containing protein [Geobacter sp.]
MVIFSQWLLMNGLVEEVLTRNGIGYVHLNGSVPSKERRGLMERFREDPACKVFLSTDAGGVGLNLQSGSVVINMDIPWNPAVLEQRIARIHRMGQKKNVRIVNFVSRGSIEERILSLLGFKSSLAAGALDAGGEDTVLFGPSQLERFMASVEEATEGLERRDAGEELREQAEAAAVTAVMDEEADEEAVSAVEPAATVSADQLRDLLMGGARLLAGLGEALAQQPASGDGGRQGAAAPLGLSIERDEATGRSSLRIPIPEPAVMQSIVSGLGNFLAALTRG